MHGEQGTEAVRGPGPVAQPPTAAPPPRPRAPAARPGAGEVAEGSAQPGPAPAARPATVRRVLGRTVAQFIVDPSTYELRVRLIDRETRMVVREIPPGDLIALIKGGGIYQGLLIDQGA